MIGIRQTTSTRPFVCVLAAVAVALLTPCSADISDGVDEDDARAPIISSSRLQARSSRGGDEQHSRFGLLTTREAEVVLALCNGHTTNEVAEMFSITRRTVESHLLNAYHKLGVHSRVALVR